MSSRNEYKKNNAGRVVGKIFTYFFLALMAFFMIIPFYYMIVTSFVKYDAYTIARTAGDIILFPTAGVATLEHYQTVFRITMGGDPAAGTSYYGGFAVYFINTLIVAVVSTAFTLVTTLLAAFAFARLNFKGKNALFMVILATMMIPGEMMVLTNYRTTYQFDWINTFSALIFVHGIAVFYIFYLRQTFQQIPNELYLASKVDGYTDFQYFRKIMVPLASPTIATIMILSLMGAWNSFIWPNLVASGTNIFLKEFGVNWSMRLVSNGLASMFTADLQADNIPGRLAGSVIVTLPLIIIFICFRKKIMTGVSRSGIKG